MIQNNRFITQTTNPAGHSSYKTYDPGTGNTQTETGVDGLITIYEYDGFGRLTETITPQSNHIYTSSNWDTGNSGGSYSLYWTKANAQGKP